MQKISKNFAKKAEVQEVKDQKQKQYFELQRIQTKIWNLKSKEGEKKKSSSLSDEECLYLEPSSNTKRLISLRKSGTAATAAAALIEM